MPDVLLSNDDITVLGPPETVEVLVDIGPSGTRGSKVFVGIGNPNTEEIGETPILNDLYINASTGDNYGFLYQYVSQPGGNTWIEILELNPVIYSKNFLIEFINGEASISIPVSNIVTSISNPLVAENFNVQFNFINNNPVAASMSIPALVGDGDDLVINFKAVEHRTDTDSGPYGDWALLDGQTTVHLFITVLSIDEES